MATFASFQGKVTNIDDFFSSNTAERGCKKIFSVVNRDGAIINFIVTPETYVVNHTSIQVGDIVTGFYDTSLPVPLIYPPQFTAVVMAKNSRYMNVTVDYFNRRLINSKQNLQLNIGPETIIILKNDQIFTGNLGNRNLIVLYDRTTRSIPAQTTPSQVVVLC
jgi:hypothetical protein